jgi:hypothetical protein
MGKKRKKEKKKESGKIPVPVIILAVMLIASAGGAAAPPVRHAVTHVFSSGPANERLADSMAADSYGWTGDQVTCLNELWDRETGGTWDPLITDPIVVHGGRAFGIAQALNHGLDTTAVIVPVIHFLDGSTETDVTINDYPVKSANAGNARAQIRWGLGYISATYGTPCGAWDDTGHDARGY